MAIDFGRGESEIDVDGTGDFAHGFQLRGKPHRAEQGSTLPLTITVFGAPMPCGERTCEQTSERGHAYERDGGVTHHAAALIGFDDRLDDRGAGGHLQHHSESANAEHNQ